MGAPNSHCARCRTRVLSVLIGMERVDLRYQADTDGTVHLTGEHVVALIDLDNVPARLPIAKEPDEIPAHVAIRYRRHECPTRNGNEQ